MPEPGAQPEIDERYPRAYDDTALYNVPSDSIDHFRPLYPFWYEDTVVRVVHSLPDPPPLSEEEAYNATQEAKECVAEFFDRESIRRLDELHEDILEEFDFVFQGDYQLAVPMDRTVILVLENHEHVTTAFVRNLQENFVRRRPDWRVGLCGSPEEEDITIYPNVVRVGNVLCPPGVLEVQVDTWKERLFQQRAAKIEERRNEILQFQHVNRVILRSINDLRSTALSFVAVFEHAARDDDDHWFTVAILVNDPTRVYRVVAPEGTLHSRQYPVYEDGSVGKPHTHWSESPLRLEFLIVRRLPSPTLVIGEGHPYVDHEVGLLPGGRRWSLQISDEIVIPNSELTNMDEPDGAPK